eukprot:gene3573-6308_t
MEEVEQSMCGTIFRKYGSINVLEVHEKLTTKPLIKEFHSSPTKVLIKVLAASVNPLDCKIRKGDYFNTYYPALPHILGKDASGIVVAVGKKVTKFNVGDEVFGCLKQFTPSTGTYCQYSCFEQEQLVLKPKLLSHREAAGLGLSGCAAYSCLVQLAKLQKDQTILIHGASGGVGSFAIQIAKHLGAKIYTTSSKENLEYCRDLGSNFALNHNRAFENSFQDTLDVVLDLKGNLNESIQEYMSKKSIFISLVNTSTFNSMAKTLFGFISGISYHFPTINPTQDVLSKVAHLASEKVLKVHISSLYALCDIKKAHEHVDKGETVGKVILDVEHPFASNVDIQVETISSPLPISDNIDSIIEEKKKAKRKSRDSKRDSETIKEDNHFHDLVYEEKNETKPELKDEQKIEEVQETRVEEVKDQVDEVQEVQEETKIEEVNDQVAEIKEEEEKQEVEEGDHPGFTDIDI